MKEPNLLKVELALWKAIAESRERQNRELSKCFDVAIDIANFWREIAPGGEYPPELAARIAALDPHRKAPPAP